MSRRFKTPFGDNAGVSSRILIPYDHQASQVVSYQDGYSPPYQATGSGARYVERDAFNGVMYDLTSALLELTDQGAPSWVDPAGDPNLTAGGKTYAQGAFVNYGGAVYQSLVNSNAARPGTDETLWRSIRLPAPFLGSVPASFDFNGARLPQVVFVSDTPAGSGAPNVGPAPAAGYLEVLGSAVTTTGSTRTQRYTDINGRVWTRGGTGTTWNPWIAAADAATFANYVQRAGDTMTGQLAFNFNGVHIRSLGLAGAASDGLLNANSAHLIVNDSSATAKTGMSWYDSVNSRGIVAIGAYRAGGVATNPGTLAINIDAGAGTAPQTNIFASYVAAAGVSQLTLGNSTGQAATLSSDGNVGGQTWANTQGGANTYLRTWLDENKVQRTGDSMSGPLTLKNANDQYASQNLAGSSVGGMLNAATAFRLYGSTPNSVYSCNTWTSQNFGINYAAIGAAPGATRNASSSLVLLVDAGVVGGSPKKSSLILDANGATIGSDSEGGTLAPNGNIVASSWVTGSTNDLKSYIAAQVKPAMVQSNSMSDYNVPLAAKENTIRYVAESAPGVKPLNSPAGETTATGTIMSIHNAAYTWGQLYFPYRVGSNSSPIGPWIRGGSDDGSASTGWNRLATIANDSTDGVGSLYFEYV